MAPTGAHWMQHREIPTSWTCRHGAYYYSVPKAARHHWGGKTQYRLGKTEADAWAEWDSKTLMLPENTAAITIADLLDKYDRDVVSQKKWKSQESNRISIPRIKGAFGKMRIASLEATHVAQYRDKVSAKHGKTSANRDLEVISHAYTKAVEWGLCKDHPTKGKVTKTKNPPRDRYVEDWEMAAAITVANAMMLAYLWVKLATGQRRKDILELTLNDIREEGEGIRIKPTKTRRSSGRKVLILWTPELLAWREYILSIRPVTTDPHVFVNKYGRHWVDPVTGRANGFDSAWGRFMDKVLAKTSVTDRFQERDLRAKTASDTDLQHASRLLVHTSQQITQMVYRRKGDSVPPLNVSNLFKPQNLTNQE